MRRFVLVFLFAATGCGFVERMFGIDELGRLRGYQRKWNALGIKDYDYDYRLLCYCLNENLTPVRISVRGGLVTSVIDRQTNLPVTGGGTWPTVDSIFARTERNLIDGYLIELEYDGFTYFFPLRVNANKPSVLDDEYQTVAGNLVKVAP